jgi:hypothetical protein
MIPVSIFNASPLAVTVVVNSATNSVWIGPSSLSLGWQPQYDAKDVSLNPGGTAGPNVLATGANSLAMTPDGSVIPTTVTLNLPRDIQWQSLQLYIFFNTYQDFSWIVLNNGAYVTGGKLP